MTEPFDTFFAVYASAARRKDSAAMAALYADDLLDFDMWSDWVHAGSASMRKLIDDWFDGLGSDQVAVEFDNIRIWPGPDLAAASAIVTFRGLDASGVEKRSMQNRLSWVAVRGPMGWRIAHQHTSAPIDPVKGTAQLRRPLP